MQSWGSQQLGLHAMEKDLLNNWVLSEETDDYRWDRKVYNVQDEVKHGKRDKDKVDWMKQEVDSRAETMHASDL